MVKVDKHYFKTQEDILKCCQKLQWTKYEQKSKDLTYLHLGVVGVPP